MTVQTPDALAIVERVADRLVGKYVGQFELAQVRDIVIDSLRRYRHLDHPSQHARALTAQLADDRLDALLWIERTRELPRPPSVLFLCSGNAGRSQLAAAVLRAITPAGTRIVSAGDRPAARILPAVIETLDEVGVPLFGEYPKPATPEFIAAADHIIVLNCNDSLDELEGHAFRTWSIALDSTSGKAGIRHTRDLIAAHVRELAREFGIEVRPL
ncbi:low molecular weight phosphatase family protein [Microcella sp.]|uniref:arsenate-mycothiol transferase ArsC n=1 Tax=Microcella sp. TaxID=1913979 RepID=UPI00256986CE|nr:low molecular weight phosphatase family protein [Microcella sp.]MBX9472581.1 low molecular weight phosphatase family protein [Microcella sp.]